MSRHNLNGALILTLILLSFWTTGYSQDSTVYKAAYAGTNIIVPDNQTWKIDRIFINDGNAYSIQVSNTNLDSLYHAGDTIRLPYYVAEMELLDKKDMVQFQLYIKPEEEK